MQVPKVVKFRVFGQTLSSEIELPELRAFEIPNAAKAEFFLGMADARESEENQVWFHHWYQDEARQVIDSSLAKAGENYRIRFWGKADFLILQSGNRIVCEPLRQTPPETIRHLFLDHVLPRVLGHRGELVVHASAVELAENFGIAFVGQSGWGKSTLASSFREAGAKFLGDDCLHLKVENGELVGVPAYGGARLWDDSREALFPGGVVTSPVSHYNSKRRVDFHEYRETPPTTFRALFFLDDPSPGAVKAPTVATLSGSAAIVELLRFSFLLDARKKDSTAGQFAAIGRLLATQPLFYTLQYPREFSRLPEVRRTILNALGVPEVFLGKQ